MSNNSKEQIDFRKEFSNWFDAMRSEELQKKTDGIKINLHGDAQLYNFVDRHVLAHKNSIPKLYSYSKADYYNIRNFEKQQIYLSPVGAFNDAYEGLPSTFSSYVEMHLDKMYDLAYVKSFTTKKNDFLMWGLYGDNYKGMCVEYDATDMSLENYYRLFPVYYTNERNFENSLEETIKELITYKESEEDNENLFDYLCLFLTKLKCWEYESEWRMIASYFQVHTDLEESKNIHTCEEIIDNPFFALCSISSNTIMAPKITAVYLGARIENVKKDHIVEIANRHNQDGENIRVFQTRISGSKQELETELITDK